MITLVDSNILIDIFGADATHGTSSASSLKKCIREGAVGACEIVWAEIATIFQDSEDYLKAMERLGIDYIPVTKEAALLSGNIWKKYLKNGGKRQRIMADFLIGASALLQGDRLLTRDRGFYREYFKGLNIIDPKKINTTVNA